MAYGADWKVGDVGNFGGLPLVRVCSFCPKQSFLLALDFLADHNICCISSGTVSDHQSRFVRQSMQYSLSAVMSNFNALPGHFVHSSPRHLHNAMFARRARTWGTILGPACNDIGK